jgi:hypothetical protein
LARIISGHSQVKEKQTMGRLLVVAVALGCAHSGPGMISPERARIEGAQALEHVRYLASDALEGRGVKTQGLRKAAEYIAAQFKQDGLTPLGDGGGYLQWLDLPVGGRVTGGTLAVGEDHPARGTGFQVLSWSATRAVRAPAVFAGYGVTDPEKKWDDYAQLNVQGKIAVVVRKLPTGKGLGDRFADVREKVSNAQKHGAVGFVLVNRPQDDDDFLRVRDTGEDRGLVAIQARREVVEKMFGAPLAELEAAGPGRVGREIDIKAEVDRQTIRIANVVGVLRGSDPALANEYVVVGAHYDHLGKGYPQAWNPFSCKNAHEGLIYHGADDNASGTAGMMEIAEAFAGEAKRPRRSIVFAAFVAEELGLIGSHHFVEHAPFPMTSVVAMINLDMIGRLREKGGLSVEGITTAPEWEQIVAHANAEGVKVSGAKTLMEDSDHASFYHKDRPVIFFFTGMHEQYHCYTDTADLVNGDGLAQVARLAYRVARDVADNGTPHAGLTFARAAVGMRGAGGHSGPRLGIAPDYNSEGGLGVSSVMPGTPAAKAGLQSGDLITMLDGKEIGNIEDYMTALGSHKFGDVIKLIVKRGAQSVTLTATLEQPKE